MVENDYDNFEDRLSQLGAGYLREVLGEEITSYFRHLAKYSIDVVSKAIDAAPEAFPAFMPKAGELAGLCEQFLIEQRGAADSVQAIKASAECAHQWEFEPEAEGGLYSGFDVCVKCGRAKPRINKAAPPVQLEYFRMATNPQERQA